MQAIQTKYFGPSNVRGSRVKASCAAKTIFLTWEDALNAEANHANAAQELAKQLGWEKDTHGGMFGGCLPDETWAWVFDNSTSPYTFAPSPVTKKRKAA